MKKTDYKHGKFTLLTSEIDTDAFTREDYEEWCEMNDIEPTDDEDDFFDYCAEETQANYESDMDNIESCKEYNVPVAVTGTLGLWWGHPEIKAERFESVADAIHTCIERSDSYDVLVEYNDGVITVNCYHHDGCNCFTIKALSKKGIAKQFADYKEHDFKRLPYLYAIGI
jgi:hypothetical protein